VLEVLISTGIVAGATSAVKPRFTGYRAPTRHRTRPRDRGAPEAAVQPGPSHTNSRMNLPFPEPRASARAVCVAPHTPTRGTPNRHNQTVTGINLVPGRPGERVRFAIREC